jgi:hypothetical protein
MKNIEFWASLVGAIIVAFIIAIWVPGEPKEKIVLAIEYGGLVITFLFGFMILAGIASSKIDISRILEEKAANGTTSGASMSRFQLLIFTFVISLSLFLIVANTKEFPKTMPPEVLTLLGISASTYAVSKGIQAGSKNGGDPATPTTVTPATVTPATVTPATITPATITPATVTPATQQRPL